LPRVLASLACGAALSVSGAVIQGVLNNRLASPGLIGVNAGAALAVTLCAAFGVLGGFRVAVFSFLGSFVTVLLVSLGAKKWSASTGTLILMGVALNSLLGAISDTVTTISPEISIFNNDFKIGDFSSVTYSKLIPALILIGLSVVILFTLSTQLDVLSLGEDGARGLGMNTTAIRVTFLFLSALLAGSAVSVCGLLSFVGLLVPHAVRRAVGSRAKHLLPLSAIFGGGFVTLCDTLARILFAPYEIPVGIIMAFIGAPFFIFILIKRKRGDGRD
jgi:iron complex transport system permease protein